MTDINKQKFLTELSRLLTFMYEEDRQMALSMYADAFDQADDEQALIAFLASPTRQAVVIARAYNAKERKLQIHSQSKDEDGYCAEQEGIPDFVQAIADALPFELYYSSCAEDEEPLPAFGEQEDATAEEAENEVCAPEQDYEPEYAEEAETEELCEADEEQAGLSEQDATDRTEEAADENVPEPQPVSEDKDEDAAGGEVVNEFSEALSKAADEAAEEVMPESREDSAADEAEETELPEDSEITDSEDEPSDREAEKDDDVQDESTDNPDGDEETDDNDEDSDDNEDEDEDEDEDEHYPAYVCKTNIPLLILFVILAVPITAALIILLFIPTVICLALAISAIAAGSAILAATFSGFAVFADIMVMLGSALVVLALGLLFLWLFIWFIGGAMVGLVRSVMELGHKWCCKEVPAL